jgi:repressor LexA
MAALGVEGLVERIAEEITGQSAPPTLTSTLPFLGVVAAGQPVEAPRHQETITVHKPYPEGAFVAEVSGASMEPTLYDGDRIVIEGATVARPKISPKDGKICVVSNGLGSLVKLFDRKRGFVSINPRFPDVVPSDELRLQGYYLETL